MKLRPLLLSTVLLIGATALAGAQAAEPSAPAKDDPLTAPRTKWWRDGKYGMFIQAIFEFLLIALALFLVIKGINKLKRPPPPAPSSA